MKHLKTTFLAVALFLSLTLCPFAPGGETPKTSAEISSSQNADAPQKSFRRIFIIRHGQRPPLADPPLSVLGIRQAELAALRLKADGFDAENATIYASPYLRTVETAAPTAKLFGKKITLSPDFQELTSKVGTPNTGGFTQEELEKIFPCLVSAQPALKSPWVYDDNSGKTLEKRVSRAVAEILKNTTGDVAIFTHSTPFKEALRALGKLSETDLDVPVWNCMVAYFVVNKDGKVGFVGISAGFIPADEISNNEKTGPIGDKIPVVPAEVPR